ncbi:MULTISPECIES: hypothetical protein [unclassified Herbaspirillum]|jgi:hypothetical protein|uniref:hypothetical protein n=1 Tax=unclassified Herbaspirillum TaxID=2624150 RepID=UPI000E2F958A|nr:MULTISPECIES: hypothetical protein [unclassified Herbaspirillum]RFB73654.1 hypothetical protein DZB54_05010 [Herbaspirillum sp. 3R-3a1]TFI10543.1 hypothetical protein E4P32_03160 [Herbaspirillum sp. 3R11]TFI16448.1 hypothetical protein E4P31_03165 [Herbaspirillum sp. 3R-11]TFI21395.1 hypothetical protein E4P30_20740 [Herbaspirillum sp. 3C11]
MTSRVKILLLWLLAFAIPVQGFAAAVQAGCASSHQMPTVVAPAADTHHHSGHAMHDMSTQADTDHTMPHQHKASSASCSSCSVCTIGAVLPLALDKLINLPVAADIHVADTPHGFVGYTPENPERPPSLSV